MAMSDTLDEQCNALAHSDAYGAKRPSTADGFELIECRRDEPGATGA